MRHVILVTLGATCFCTVPVDAVAAAPPPAAPIKLYCSGSSAVAARKIASREKLSLALNPKACLAQTSMYGGGSHQIIAQVPFANCRQGRAIQIYERATSGTWGTLFEKPVCGMVVSYGPNNPWGGIMITVDGQHYDQRGAYYTPAKY